MLQGNLEAVVTVLAEHRAQLEVDGLPGTVDDDVQ